MAQIRKFSLRPQQAKSKEPGLERLFRIELRGDELAAEKIAHGDFILLECPETRSGGVGVASLSNDVPKNPVPIARISDSLKDMFGLKMSDKCTISKYEDKLRLASQVVLSDVTPPNNPVPVDVVDDLEYCVGLSLAQLPVIAPGYTFDVIPRLGEIVARKRTFRIETIEADGERDDTRSIFLPCWFHLQKSKIQIQGGPVDTTPEKKNTDDSVHVDFPGLQGLDQQLNQLRRHIGRINRVLHDHYKSVGLGQPNPVLVHGPSGVGKTAVLDMIAQAHWKKVIRLNDSTPNLSPTKAEGTIKILFSEASASQPSLILIDDLEDLAGRKKESDLLARALKRHIQKLSGSRVQVVASASRSIDIDQKLLNAFRKVIELPIPTLTSRGKILEELVGAAASTEDIQYVASRTHAFTAADLHLLCDEACDPAIERSETLINGERMAESLIDATTSSSPPSLITRDDFDKALLTVHPSAMNEAYIEVPEVRWSQIAGSTEVKQKLQDAVELPLKHPELVEHMNMHTSSGILMYGPPGCSKTLTAKALATESGLNFIAVKGPELISKYVGESEYKIRQVFQKARAAAPSVIFFDEIDSIAPNRGSGGHEGLNTVATLLNEMDGVEDVKKVLVLAATNRPDAIDPALLRPGRLGATIFIGPPNQEAIESILKMHTDKMHAMEDLELGVIAERMFGDKEKCYSGADVAALCQEACSICVKEMRDNKEVTGLRRKDLDAALVGAKPSLSIEAVEVLRNWSIAG